MGDIQVETFDVSFSSDGTTHTLTNDVGSTDDAFVLNLTARRTSAGNTGSAANQNWDDFCAGVRLTDTDELTFYRPAAGAGTIRMMGEVWRYSGSGGGGNEFIKRYSGAVTIASGDTTADQSVSGVSDVDNVVCFVTGVEADLASRNEGNRVIATARMTSSSNLQVERGETGTAVIVYVEVVEFTGANWTIVHWDSGIIGSADTATPTIYPNYDYTGTAVTISDWTTAFIWGDMLGDATGANHALEDTWFVVEDNSSTSVLVTLDSTAVCGRARGYVIQNDDLSVERETAGKAIPAGLDTSLTDPSNITTADERSIAEWYVFTDGGGTAYARGAVTAKLNGSAVEAYVHRSGNTGTYRYAGIDLSSLSDGGTAYDITADGTTYTETGTDATLLADRTIDAATDSYTLTGTSADTLKGYAFDADTESFSVSGTDANFESKRLIDSEVGAFELTGSDAAVLLGHTVDSEAGSSEVSGADAALLRGYAVDVEAGSVDNTGADADLLRGYALDVESASFTDTGTAAALEKGYAVALDVGSFVLAGIDVTLTYESAEKILNAESDAVTNTGFAAALLKGFINTAEVGSYQLTGQPANVYKDLKLKVEQGSISVGGKLYLGRDNHLYMLHGPLLLRI